MLHEFVVMNREEIVRRCRGKVALRVGHHESSEALGHGVSLFLHELVEKLRHAAPGEMPGDRHPPIAIKPADMRHAAAIHGAELMRSRYSIDQVVHEYGDICQTVTELAIERDQPVSTREFGILNLCLDCAIADAVTSYSLSRESIISERAENLHAKLELFSLEHERLAQVAREAFAAIRSGSVGTAGATATLLDDTLAEIALLSKRVLPELRLASVKTMVV